MSDKILEHIARMEERRIEDERRELVEEVTKALEVQHKKDIAVMDSIIQKQRDNLNELRQVISERNDLIRSMAKFIGR
jgi:hypothetical protein